MSTVQSLLIVEDNIWTRSICNKDDALKFSRWFLENVAIHGLATTHEIYEYMDGRDLIQWTALKKKGCYLLGKVLGASLNFRYELVYDPRRKGSRNKWRWVHG